MKYYPFIVILGIIYILIISFIIISMYSNANPAKESDNIYLNIVINHDDTLGSAPSIAEYNVNKTQPILDRCSDYYCSVIRFDIPLDDIPLFIMPIVPASPTLNPQPEPNLTPMVIGVEYLGVNHPVPIIYIPDRPSYLYPPPVQNVIGKQVITSYYYVYSYQNLLTSINNSLRQAIEDAGLLPLITERYIPFFYLDTVSDEISLVVPNTFTDSPAGPKIYMNTPLNNYLSGFRTYYQGYDQPDGKDFIFQLTGPSLTPTIFPTAQNLYPNPGLIPVHAASPPAAPTLLFKVTQEYNTLVYWTSLRKILITTNTIPIVNEFIPAKGRDTGEVATLPILTDFIPSIELGGDSRSISYYYPQGQYKLTDMISDLPLYKINIRIMWEDRQNNLYPLYITQFQQASIKLAFFRKSLYKPMNLLLK